jgi:two-component system LytT family sensor kinase
VLHRAGLAAEPLRGGLDHSTATKAVRHLRALIGCRALAVGDGEHLLALDGPAEHHRDQIEAALRRIVASQGSGILRGAELACDEAD